MLFGNCVTNAIFENMRDHNLLEQKYSILIGAPKLAEFNGFVGVIEYMWEWPSERFPESVLLRCSSDFCEKDYFSRFIKGIYAINATKEEIIDACDKARQAQFEFGKTPVKIVK